MDKPDPNLAFGAVIVGGITYWVASYELSGAALWLLTLSAAIISGWGLFTYENARLQRWRGQEVPSSLFASACGWGVTSGVFASWIASNWLSGIALLLAALAFAILCSWLFYQRAEKERKQISYQIFEREAYRDRAKMMERDQRRSLPTLNAADMELVEKLIMAYPGYLPRRAGLVGNIGKELNARGGNDLMLAAYCVVKDRLGGVAARELEVAWDGIGEWQG